MTGRLLLSLRAAVWGFGALLLAPAIGAQVLPDSGLLREIEALRAVDEHAHPMPVLGAGMKDELDPPESVPPLGPPTLLRPGNPQWPRAWRALYGYSSTGESVDLGHLESLRRAARAQQGNRYPAWILDKLNIETMLANRHSGGPGLESPRFRLVWYADPLVFPLDNETGKAANPQRREGFEVEEAWLKRYMSDEHVVQLPPNLDQYISTVVLPSMRRQKTAGAVGIKLAIAYLRDLGVANPSHDEAAQVYGSYARRGAPPADQYHKLQDYLIRRIVAEAGRLGLPVQIHVGAGSGPFFDNAGADPFLLMPMLLDSGLRKTNFVLVHGGFPNASATRVLFAKPNVYADFSSQAFLSSTRELSQVIRGWIEFRPEKVMFGTDAYPFTASVGWEEVAWMTNASSRRALAIALTGMIEDGEITRRRASEIARMVMRDNAISLYQLTRQ